MIITISGKPGSGKSTIAKLLAKRLNYAHYSAGDFVREIAKEKKISILSLVKKAEKEGTINKLIDDRTETLGKTRDNFVMDGRLAWKFIQHSKKIFLEVDTLEAAKRIAGLKREQEKYESPEEARKNIEERAESEQKQYKEQYGIDPYEENNYDLIIDTTGKTPDEIIMIILKKLKL